MWDFTHDPLDRELAEQYDVHLTEPAQCARELNEGRADLGLIPIAALTPELRIVPGCTIASLERVRSIQIVVKGRGGLQGVKTLAADTASRSSVAYAQVLFRHFLGVDPELRPMRADLGAMLEVADAALLIGDPALKAYERRNEFPGCEWFDLAAEWRGWTGLPWVAAVWAVRPEALASPEERRRLVKDLNLSREHGVTHTKELVAEWVPRIGLPAEVIQEYLTRNIHYTLDEPCVEAMGMFRRLAADAGVLPTLETLRFLEV